MDPKEFDEILKNLVGGAPKKNELNLATLADSAADALVATLAQMAGAVTTAIKAVDKDGDADKQAVLVSVLICVAGKLAGGLLSQAEHNAAPCKGNGQKQMPHEGRLAMLSSLAELFDAALESEFRKFSKDLNGQCGFVAPPMSAHLNVTVASVPQPK